MKKALLILLNGTELYEASAFNDVSGWSTSYGKAVRLVKAGISSPVNCSFNVSVTPEVLLKDCKSSDYAGIAVPGGMGEYGFYNDAASNSLKKLIRDFDRDGKPIVSVCTGAFVLGKSGILKNRKATTYHKMKGLKKQQLAPYCRKISSEMIVRDEHIITSSCPETAVSVAFEFLSMLTDKKNSLYIKDIMGF